MATEKIPTLDMNTDGYRRFYFWRNILRTLEETRKALNQLNSDRAFRTALAAEPVVLQAFHAATKKLNTASEGFLKKFRNVIGGHVDAATMQAALDGLDSRRQGYIETGDIKGKIHYRFAGELLFAALEQSVSSLSGADVETLVRESGHVLSDTWDILDDLIVCYAAERRLS